MVTERFFRLSGARFIPVRRAAGRGLSGDFELTIELGRRHGIFDDPAMDQMMTFIVELATEVSVLRERLNTVELLLDDNDTISRDDIEAYRPGEATESQRTADRTGLVERIFRMHRQ